jgi:hypothetical protein
MINGSDCGIEAWCMWFPEPGISDVCREKGGGQELWQQVEELHTMPTDSVMSSRTASASSASTRDRGAPPGPTPGSTPYSLLTETWSILWVD